ncbi:hypothetical protein MT325_m743L [Paramecium bursaria chlorella virus MT325]|uniref:Uncharacterized protein m743L n=1 Tax=Paramecium bursaria Chlorella virus MT325 TaxID=346932 RepID=A7IVC3_PBCVM|nr:hypothetical protein MT325_m743L [Paramecium bursaria chlorella virus MT325]
MNGSMSLLPMDAQHLMRAAFAATFTEGRRSTMHSDNIGTISGRKWETCSGTFSAILASRVRAFSFTCHLLVLSTGRLSITLRTK